MNGNWNPWSEQVNGNKSGQFVLAWRHVHDIFTAQGVTNVTWVWSPNIDFSNSVPLRKLYPGNSYVDWIAMDGYISQIPHNFSRIRAVIWFDQDKETDWRIESSFTAQNAFATAIQSGMYTSNRYASLNISPIPVP